MAAPKIVPPRPRTPYWKGLGADSEEKHEPVGDTKTAKMDSLKVLDPKRPTREADIDHSLLEVCLGPGPDLRLIRGTVSLPFLCANFNRYIAAY